MSNIFRTVKGTELPISDIKGKRYLEIKWRVLWFLEEKPLWAIHTEFVHTTDKAALAKATITDEQGRIRATGHKYEDVTGFADFREKAETGAVGRALALIGYGTQFASELEEGERLADSPVARRQNGNGTTGHVISSVPSESVKDYVVAIGKKHNGKKLWEIKPEDLAGYCNWLQDESHKKNKPLEGKALELIQKATLYFKELGLED